MNSRFVSSLKKPVAKRVHFSALNLDMPLNHFSKDIEGLVVYADSRPELLAKSDTICKGSREWGRSEEKDWQHAKHLAAKQRGTTVRGLGSRDWALVQHIYKKHRKANSVHKAVPEHPFEPESMALQTAKVRSSKFTDAHLDALNKYATAYGSNGGAGSLGTGAQAHWPKEAVHHVGTLYASRMRAGADVRSLSGGKSLDQEQPDIEKMTADTPGQGTVTYDMPDDGLESAKQFVTGQESHTAAPRAWGGKP